MASCSTEHAQIHIEPALAFLWGQLAVLTKLVRKLSSLARLVRFLSRGQRQRGLGSVA